MSIVNEKTWIETVIKRDEYERYLRAGKHFIPEDEIWRLLEAKREPTREEIEDIISKSLSLETLTPEETAALINVKDPELWEEIFRAALEVKRKVYDNRIVTFAPLYCSSYCVNDCLYCGFRRSNPHKKVGRLSLEEIREQVEILAGKIGHKRLIVVYGEHPLSDVDYIRDTIETIYSVKVKARVGYGEIRRVNVNAAPMSIEKLRVLKEVGIGTFQVFQETYHRSTYEMLHPKGTIKHDYLWRLYALHRAIEAGIDDVGIGALFGLYDWRFEVMGLVYHAWDLERTFGVGPHTISFPRLKPAIGAPLSQNPQYNVSDEELKKIVAILRLAVPYTGMILTAREPRELRDELILIGVTQTDASTRIDLGGYKNLEEEQHPESQQFLLGDTRSLDELVRDLAKMGFITSFCTAGYRCARTGELIMKLLKEGKERWFCKLNAILTFREWLDDFASPETKAVGEELIQREIDELKRERPKLYEKLIPIYERILNGERDLYF